MKTKNHIAPTKTNRKRSICQSILSIVLLSAPSAIALSSLLLPLIATPASAQTTTPLPKDWCGRLWGIRSNTNNAVLWDNPSTGASSTTPPSTSIAAIPTLTGSGYATLGIHARSGTLYTLDRNTSILYRYSMATGGAAWTQTQLSIPTILGSGTLAQIATSNFNKMTVTGDQLLISNSDSSTLYTYTITPDTGAISAAGSSATTFDSFTPLPNGTTGNPTAPVNVTVSGTTYTTLIGGGDIAQDEYGDTYNLTYDNYYLPSNLNNTVAVGTQYAYIYKKVGSQWVYKDRVQKVNSGDQFAGLAFYADAIYVKGTVGTLFKLGVTRVAGDYDWAGNAGALTTVGTGTGTSDLASCGVPAISVTKSQGVFSDPAATIATADQTRIGTGQYIKYTIVATNVGDAWARDAYLKDALPAGVTYVPNSATENGQPLNAATYPFTNAPATGAGSPTGQIRLPFNSNTNVSTYTYIVQVTGTAPNVTNQAEVGYLNPYPSDPPNCATGLNCGTSPLAALFPSIFGTVWNDKNGSANQTFTNIFTTGEAGTNTGTANALYALLVNSAGNVVSSSAVGTDGKFGFQALNTNQNNLTIRLSTTAGTVGSAAPTAAIPAGWKSTSPRLTTAFNLATVDITDKDFGVSLPTGLVMVKRVTGIKPVGATTWNRTANPYDNTVSLNTVVPNPTGDPAGNATNNNWPANYVVGAHTAGKVQPGDEIEYTIYYLNTKGADTKNLKICDPIRGRQSYTPGSMQLLPGGSTTPIALTDAVNVAVDRANSYAAGAAPTDCNAGNTTATGADKGGVAIQITGTGSSAQPDIAAIPSATGVATPSTAYGLFRFTTKVDP